MVSVAGVVNSTVTAIICTINTERVQKEDESGK